jgi:hypothetical protein
MADAPSENELLPPDAGLDVLMLANRATFTSGDALQIAVRSNRDCHLTLISIDQRGRGMVLFPSDFEPSNLLKAGKALKVPADGASYVLRLRETGRESVVGICSTAAATVDGISHDFERQRFTDLGDYATYLSQAIGREAAGQSQAGQPAAPIRGRTKRLAAPATERPKPDQIWRGAITLEVK